mgnify:FL=1
MSAPVGGSGGAATGAGRVAFKLRPYQIAAINGARRAFAGDRTADIKPARAVIDTLPTGCHARGQGILMFDGSIKAVEDVLVGDRLMGPDLRPRQVLTLHRGREQMATIFPHAPGLEPWTVNMGHILTLAPDAEAAERPEAWVEMTVADYIAVVSRGGSWPWLLVRVRREMDAGSPPADSRLARFEARSVRVTTHHFIVREHQGDDAEADYYGFEIDGDHRYLLDDGTVTHNSGKSVIFKAVALGVVERGRRVLLIVEGVKLVTQAAKHFREAGLRVGIEMAEETALPWSGLSKPQKALLESLPREGELDADGVHGLFVKGAKVLSAAILCERGLARKVREAERSAGGWYVRLEPDLPQVVVASIDSIINRLDQYPTDFFRMIICDECHHSLAPTYLETFKYFGVSVPLNDPKDIADLKKSPWVGDVLLFGLTATPDRGDKRDLMRLFEVVGYEYDILSAINDGWLVPIRQEFCHLDGLDLSKVRKSAGDLDATQLCELLEPLMVKICDSVVAVAAGRPTLCYSPLCSLAETATRQLRIAAPDKQIHTIVGETEDDQREAWFAGIDRGEVWALSSVGTLTEGVDLPRAAVAAMLRLTMSRLLYAQILGRVLRPAPEIANALNDLETPEERKALIAASSKPTATILDFAGNSGKHKLVRAVDILADPDDPALNLAEREMEKGERDPIAALEKAQAELAKMLERARNSDVQRILVNPFDLLDVPQKKDEWGRAATDKQIAYLLESGVIDYRKNDPAARAAAIEKLKKMFDMTSASAVIAERNRRIEADMCNPKQMRMLIKAGLPAKNVRAMPFKVASAALDQLAANAWKSTPAWIERWSDVRREAA